MGRTLLKLASLILALSVISCRAVRVPVNSGTVNGNATSYIETYKDLAMSEMERTGVPASITLAQGMVESDYGRSSLARVANNHFGIKCHNDWDGQSIKQHDDKRNECFRKYKSPEESFQDHSDFLKSGSRYSFLFRLGPTDYKAWAHGLKKAGYATNPDYANMIIRKIEENRLYQFDQVYTAKAEKPSPSLQKPITQSKPKPAAEAKTPEKEETITFGEVMAMAPRIMQNNRVQYIIVREGETLDQIESEFMIKKGDLADYNDLKPDFNAVPGQILYLEPKREKSEPGKEFHTAIKGDTMYLISQRYAVRLKNLLDMNGMSAGTEPIPGQRISLQEGIAAN